MSIKEVISIEAYKENNYWTIKCNEFGVIGVEKNLIRAFENFLDALKKKCFVIKQPKKEHPQK